MALVYRPPGVFFEQISSPTIAPLLAVPASICLLADAQGYLQRTDIIIVSGTDAIPLPNVPADSTLSSGSIVSIKDALNPAIAPDGYTTDDYTFNAANKTVARKSSGVMPDGSTLYVTYTYTPNNYFRPIRLNSMAAVEERFGQQYDESGTTINSQMSYAASIAFENGATDVVCQPIYAEDPSTFVRSKPSASQLAAATTWQTVLNGLRDIEDINVFVPIYGQSLPQATDATWLAVAQKVQDHLQFLRSENRFAIAIFGEDSSVSSSVGQKATLIAHASQLRARYSGQLSEQIAFISPSKFSRNLSAVAGTQYVGGQWVAAALAGMIAARAVNNPLTRKPIAGFVEVADYRSKSDKNADATAGLLVVEQKGNIVQPRHAITLDDSSSERRELSIVRSKFRMIDSVRTALEENVIGKVVVDDNATNFINQIVTGTLQALVKTGDVISFGNVQARIASFEPTLAEVRFSYKPAYPINYITVIFSLDLADGSLNVETATNASAANI